MYINTDELSKPADIVLQLIDGAAVEADRIVLLVRDLDEAEALDAFHPAGSFGSATRSQADGNGWPCLAQR